MTSPAPCTGCGNAVPPGARFCPNCGQNTGWSGSASVSAQPAPPAPPPSSAPPPPPGSEVAPTPTGPGLDSPVVQGAVVFVAGAVLSGIGWYPLGAPAGLISKLVPDAFCGGSGYSTGSLGMYFCAARAGLLNLVGPIVVSILLVVFRKPIARFASLQRPKIPPRFGFLLSPLLATGFFTMAYSGIHWETASRGGLLPKQMFPAVIGLIVFAMPFAVKALNRARPEIFDRRDRIPAPVRVVLALMLPLVLSFLWTNTPSDVQSPVTKEQIVILLASSLGFLAFIPRGGSLVGLAENVTRQVRSGLDKRRGQ